MCIRDRDYTFSFLYAIFFKFDIVGTGKAQLLIPNGAAKEEKEVNYNDMMHS